MNDGIIQKIFRDHHTDRELIAFPITNSEYQETINKIEQELIEEIKQESIYSYLDNQHIRCVELKQLIGDNK